MKINQTVYSDDKENRIDIEIDTQEETCHIYDPYGWDNEGIVLTFEQVKSLRNSLNSLFEPIKKA